MRATPAQTAPTTDCRMPRNQYSAVFATPQDLGPYHLATKNFRNRLWGPGDGVPPSRVGWSRNELVVL